jgi:hypothetical protein
MFNAQKHHASPIYTHSTSLDLLTRPFSTLLVFFQYSFHKSPFLSIRLHCPLGPCRVYFVASGQLLPNSTPPLSFINVKVHLLHGEFETGSTLVSICLAAKVPVLFVVARYWDHTFSLVASPVASTTYSLDHTFFLFTMALQVLTSVITCQPGRRKLLSGMVPKHLAGLTDDRCGPITGW